MTTKMQRPPDVPEPGLTRPRQIDASCRVPLLALFGGAALWLVIGSVLAMIASIKFHAPDFLADCPWLTYGRVQPAADDALLYGFCIPAGARRDALDFCALEPDAAVPAVRARRRREPLASRRARRPRRHFDRRQHRFCVAGISARRLGAAVCRVSAHCDFRRGHVRPAARARTVSVALVFAGGAVVVPVDLLNGAICSWSRWPVRGVAQAVIGWWFANNLLFVWLGLGRVWAWRFISCRNSPVARCKAITSRCSHSGR